VDTTVLLAGGVVGAHGVGHVLGWLPALGLARFEGVSGSSWLLGPLGAAAERVAAGVAFGLPTVGFLAAVGAMATGHGWFRTAAIASAVVSLGATAVFPRALPARARGQKTCLSRVARRCQVGHPSAAFQDTAALVCYAVLEEGEEEDNGMDGSAATCYPEAP